MVHYKLFYFPLRGAAEIARQLFALADVPFEDVRIKHEDFPARKSEMPFGQIPVLEIDGKKFGQSAAITRYLAHTFGFAGKTPLEMLAVDALYEQFRDYQTEARPAFAILASHQEGDKDKAYKETLLPARDKLFRFCMNSLNESGSDYFIGNDLTYVDLVVAEHVATLLEYHPDFLSSYDEIDEHMKKVRSNEKLARWIENRPKTPY